MSRSPRSPGTSLDRNGRQLCLWDPGILFKSCLTVGRFDGPTGYPSTRNTGSMKIGVPKEIKTNENRIALVPAGAEMLIGAGHTVLIETGGGLGSGFSDEDYTEVGATIAP